jgi:F-type H+-transporting ATPase subunit delta
MRAYNKEIGHIVETYAQTIFDIAVETQLTSEVDADLDSVRKIFAEEKDLMEMMASPYFTSQHRTDLLQKVFSKFLSELTMNFMMVLVRHNRIKYLPEITACYDRIWGNYKGYLPVKITVPKRMDNDWIVKLADDISTALKRKISLDISIDPSIIGGIIIRYGDKVVDNTIRTRLVSAVQTVTSWEKRWMRTYEV